MKRLIILTIATIFTLGLFAQSNSVVTEEIKGNGYTYVKETLNNTIKIKLYNKENEYTNVPLVNINTGKRPSIRLQEKRVEDDDLTFSRIDMIINKAFTDAQKEAVKGHCLGVAIYINSSTGRIMEIDYSFIKTSPFAEIPVSVFREIELKVKDDICFMITDAGRKYNYVYFFWMHEIE